MVPGGTLLDVGGLRCWFLPLASPVDFKQRGVPIVIPSTPRP